MESSMTEVIDTIEYEDGVVAEISHDEFCESPIKHDDAVEIVVLSRRYSDPAEGRLGSTGSEVEQWRKDNAVDWFTINLWAYDHSGVVYRASDDNPFTVDREWDTAQAGIVALKRSEFGKGDLSDAEMAEYASRIADEYSDWAAGNCYAFVLKDADGSEVAEGNGLIGREALEAAAADAARQHLFTRDVQATTP
jgi:hypothetical protein